MGIHDAGRVLDKLAHWTLGDESEAERIAGEFLSDSNARGREIRELGESCCCKHRDSQKVTGRAMLLQFATQKPCAPIKSHMRCQ